MTNVEVVRFEPCELVTCDSLLLSDFMFKEYCDFLNNQELESNEPLIKPETDTNNAEKTPYLTNRKQLVLARSCLYDVIYALHCLGLWCAKKTVKLYLTEFSRLLENDPPAGDIIAATATILNCLYGRLDELSTHLKGTNDDDNLLDGSTFQLQSLLHYIKDFKPPPNTSWPICIVRVRKKVIAKVIALWLSEVASQFDDYNYIKPNYIVGSSRKHRNRMAVDNFDLHHETSIRDFRFGNCNTLVVSTLNEKCADLLRCNLVVSFDPPARFSDFVQAKNNCRHDTSKYVIFLNDLFECNLEQRLLDFINAERVLNIQGRRETLEPEETELMKSLESEFPPYPGKSSKNPATIWRSIGIINKYCTKLPSDSFTKLTPTWNIHEWTTGDDKMSYYCEIRLPINSPVRQTIVGPQAPTRNISTRLAAFTACKVLHKAGELDDNMSPIRKESMRSSTPWLGVRNAGHEQSSSANGGPSSTTGPPPRMTKAKGKNQSIGSTKHRQYYRKRIARAFSGPTIREGTNCHLYKFKMTLTCPLPDEQNRRGRRIIDPGDTNRNYAIVCADKLPKICSFPVFTRSGEVMISVELVRHDFNLTARQVKDLRTFHEYTFSKVLRLEKYPTMFDPDKSPFTVLLAPVIDITDKDTDIDWSFVDKIVTTDSDSFAPSIEERKNFKFNHDDYVDAVVIPWYRLTDRQQFAYYVAEICPNMNPNSQFPDRSSGFDTFVDYYESKYNICIYNKEQPVLDVDHTSARLNLLTPRYVNRKGRTLPSSTAKTRKESRESLVQKQLLIPELCTIHPFPASFWRKAVCLPCIFYRLNSLFLAEELRREVAQAIKVGFVEPPEGFEWPALDFGWSLKDVINGYSGEDNDSDYGLGSAGERNNSKKLRKKKRNKAFKPLPIPEEEPVAATSQTEASLGCGGVGGGGGSGEYDFVIDTFDPSKLDIPDIPLDAPPDWMNIKLISTKSSGGGSSTGYGWDQPLEQRDLFLQHTNEITWDDCEMEFEGEMTERPGDIRCGSPSSFEPGSSSAIHFGDTHHHHSSNISYNSRDSGCYSNRLAATMNLDDSMEDDDDDDDEEDDSLNGSGGGGGVKSSRNEKSKPAKGAANIRQSFDYSDSSWSEMSENDDGGDEDDDRASSYCQPDWKNDDKTKNQPLLRELFIPYVAQPNPLDAMFNKAQQVGGSSDDQTQRAPSAGDGPGVDDPNGNESSVIAIPKKMKNLVTTLVKQNSKLNLVEFLKLLFNDDDDGDVDDTKLVANQLGDKEIAESISRWLDILRELDQRVETLLLQNPDMLRDNGIELITVNDSLGDFSLEMQPTFGELLPNRDVDCEWPSEEWKNIKFDPTRREISSNGPGPSVILQALTMSNASDGINLERFETVGDSFLKYSVTAYLYCMYPTMHEGRLSYLRSTEISNANLYYLGNTKRLGELMSATKFEPNDNWLAPGYLVADVAGPSEGDSSSGTTTTTTTGKTATSNTNGTSGGGRGGSGGKKREIDKALAEVPYDLLRQHSIPDKSIADCVEALIGAYLTASGSRAALLFMQWLGLRVVPASYDLEKDLQPRDSSASVGDADDELWRWLGTPASPLICVPPSYDGKCPADLRRPTDGELKQMAIEELDRLYRESNMAQFERDIEYTFKDKAYLVQAFTHNSYNKNHVTDCHQRLEFLGDALLDYLITRYLFEDPRCHSPGTLTDLRSALVNNAFFASLAVKYDFHKYLKYISDELYNVISNFVKKFRFDTKDTITKGYTLLISEGESEYAEDIEVPKALGDVFESVAGAIYLDSGMSLDQVWQVYFKMMKPEIEYFSSHVPRSPIRELLESMPQNVRFSPSELAPDRKHRVTAEVFGLGRFTGVGRNKHSAKSTAAKRALRMLALKRRHQEAAAEEEERPQHQRDQQSSIVVSN